MITKYLTERLIKAVEISFLAFVFIFLFSDKTETKDMCFVVGAFVALVAFIWNVIRHYEEKELERSEKFLEEDKSSVEQINICLNKFSKTIDQPSLKLVKSQLDYAECSTEHITDFHKDLLAKYRNKCALSIRTALQAVTIDDLFQGIEPHLKGDNFQEIYETVDYHAEKVLPIYNNTDFHSDK